MHILAKSEKEAVEFDFPPLNPSICSPSQLLRLLELPSQHTSFPSGGAITRLMTATTRGTSEGILRPGGRTSPPLPDRGHSESNEAASASTAEETQTSELEETLGSLLCGHENDEGAVEAEAARTVQLDGTLGSLLDGQKTNDSARGGGGADPNDAAGGRTRLAVRGPTRPGVAADPRRCPSLAVVDAAGACNGGHDEDPKGRRRPVRRPGSPLGGSYTNVDWHDVPQEEDDAIGRRI